MLGCFAWAYLHHLTHAGSQCPTQDRKGTVKFRMFRPEGMLVPVGDRRGPWSFVHPMSPRDMRYHLRLPIRDTSFRSAGAHHLHRPMPRHSPSDRGTTGWSGTAVSNGGHLRGWSFRRAASLNVRCR